MDCSPPGSSVHGNLQARVLEWVANVFSRGSSRPRDQTRVFSTAGRFFTVWAREACFFLKWHANRGQELKHRSVRTRKNHIRDLPGGPVVKNLHFHCRCLVWIPGQELRSHMTWGVAAPPPPPPPNQLREKWDSRKRREPRVCKPQQSKLSTRKIYSLWILVPRRLWHWPTAFQPNRFRYYLLLLGL